MVEATSPQRRSRRKSSTSDDTIVNDGPVASSSTSKIATRSKRDPKASVDRDTVSPPPDQELTKKSRTRRGHSKDSESATKPSISKRAKTNQDETSLPDGAEASPAPAAEGSKVGPAKDDESDGDLITANRASQSKATSSKQRPPEGAAGKRGKTPPAKQKPTDLALALFDDEEDHKEEEQQQAKRADSVTSERGDDEVIVHSRKRRRALSEDSQDESHPSSASFSTAVEHEAPQIKAADSAALQLRIRQLEFQLTEAKAKAEQSTGIITKQQAVFQDMHGQCICHICIEPSFRPCVLAPCGHVFCIHCLRSWFTKHVDGEAQAPTSWSTEERERYQRNRILNRKKICPSCRTELACPPVEVFLVRDMLEKVDEGLQLSKQAGVDSHLAASSDALLTVDDKVRRKGEDLPKGAKLWEDIFSANGPRRIIFDEVDGVPRCGSCGSEIFDGACSNPHCAIEYDSNSDYEDMRRGGYDDLDEMDTDMDGDDVDRPYRGNVSLGQRLREFEERNGRSEGLHRGTRLDRDDVAAGRLIGLISSDDELGGYGYDDYDHEDEEDDEDLDDFIVRDDDGLDGRRNGHEDDDSVSEGNEDEDDMDRGDGGYWDDDEDEDDFLPGPRRGARGAAIEISDDDDDDDASDSSIEYGGTARGAGRGRVVDDDEDDDEDDEENRESEGGRSDDEEEETDRQLGSSTDSGRRRRARIVNDEDDEDENEDDL